MPYASDKQRKFFNANPEKVGGKDVVDEFNKASKGKDLPEKVGAKKGAGPMAISNTACCGKGCNTRKHIRDGF